MRNVCFTLNNFDNKELFTELPEHVKYIVWQEEKGEKTARNHLQGYVEVDSPRAFSFFKKLLGKTAHLESRKGTALEASTYCKKEESRVSGPWELGALSKQGARVDLEGFRDAVKRKATNEELLETNLICMAKYPRLLATIRATVKPDITPDLRVVLHLGATGTGKTRSVTDEWNTAGHRWYTPPISQQGSSWWDGYDSHTHVLLDEWEGKITLSNLLRILDIYPLQLPCKGGHVWFRPHFITITSNMHPIEWYEWAPSQRYPRGREVQLAALRRRIHSIVDFNDPTHPDITNKGWELFIIPTPETPATTPPPAPGAMLAGENTLAAPRLVG